MHQELSLSTRLTIAIVALVIFTAGTVGLLSYRNILALTTERTLARLDSHGRTLATDLTNIVKTARTDVKGFRYGIGLMEIVARDAAAFNGGRTLAQWRDRVAERYAAELEAKPDYAQFHLVGLADGGLELIRVQRQNDNSIRIVPDAALQLRHDPGFFAAALAAGDGMTVVSTADLQQQNGAADARHRPVIRIASPLFTPEGAAFGVLAINVDPRAAFRRFDASSGDAVVHVVNERGVYLNPPGAGGRSGPSVRIQDDFPKLARAIENGAPQSELIDDRDGKRFFTSVSAARFPDNSSLYIIEAVAEDKVIAASAAALRDSSLIGGMIAVLVAVLLAVFFAQSLTRPLTLMTGAVAGFSQDRPLVLPLTAAGEIGVLARAFKTMAYDMRAKNTVIRRDKDIFESIMSTMTEAVLLIDAKGGLIYQNHAAGTIVESAGKEGPGWNRDFEVFEPDGTTPLPRTLWPSERCLRGESVEEFEMQFRASGSGRLKYLLCSAHPIRDPDGLQTGAVIVTRDVTDTKETERLLRQSQKLDAIGQLTGGIAHDFNNMLTVITGTAEILVQDLAEQPELAGIARMIEQAADRGAQLTRHLLAFARKQPLQPSNVDVNAMVHDAARMLRATLGEHIEIVSVLEDSAAAAHIDPTQLSTALLNLAVNARDAMPKGGKLLLETGNVVLDGSYLKGDANERPGAYVMIAVSDTGTGIPAGLRDKVFEPFFTTKAIGKGTGLGLSMVYGFVKQSNGHVRIYSEEGYGTTIKLYLPRADAVAEEVAVEAPIEGGAETILVVEDDELVRGFVITQLHGLGYRTLTAASGHAALALIDAGASFDLLFTDVVMPGGMNGRKLADAAAQRGPVKVLFTSGYTEDAIVHHGRLDAGVLLLPKPYRKSELARMVRAALASEPAAANGSPPARAQATG